MRYTSPRDGNLPLTISPHISTSHHTSPHLVSPSHPPTPSHLPSPSFQVQSPTPASPGKDDDDEDDDDEDDEEETFNWVFVALMSDGTLRQYANELMSDEIARIKLGYLVQADFLEDPPDT